MMKKLKKFFQHATPLTFGLLVALSAGIFIILAAASTTR
jgi:hypothetical protein